MHDESVQRRLETTSTAEYTKAGDATHTFLTSWENREASRRYLKSEEHGISHSREPGEIMARTEVLHEAYEILMDSRGRLEWIGRDPS